MGPPDGPRWRTVVRGNVLWLSLVSLLNDTASEMIYPLLPFFLVGTLGAGTTVLGLIEGIAESVSSFLKLASGWVSDRFDRRKPLVAWGYGIAALVRPVMAVTTAAWQVLAIRATDRVGKGLRDPPRDALLAAAVEPERRGMAFGVHRAADHAGAMLGPLIAAGLLLLMPGRIRWVFALAAIPGLIAIAVVLLRVKELPRSAAPKEAPKIELAGLGPPFTRYLFVLALFTLGNASDAFLLLRAGDLGVPMAAVPLLWGAHHASKMLWAVPGGMLADRFGPRRAIVAGWLLYALVYAGFALSTEAWHAWALFLVYGLFYGLTEAPEKALVAALAPPERRGSAFGAYHFAIGIAALPASLLFGWLWAAYSPTTAFLFGAALSLVAAMLLPVASRAR